MASKRKARMWKGVITAKSVPGILGGLAVFDVPGHEHGFCYGVPIDTVCGVAATIRRPRKFRVTITEVLSRSPDAP